MQNYIDTLKKIEGLVRTNNAKQLNALLKNYKGEYKAQEQNFCLESIEVVRNGRSSFALRSLVSAGFDFLSRDEDSDCPIIKLVDLYWIVNSRKPEIETDIRWVMEKQYFSETIDLSHNDEKHLYVLSEIADIYCPDLPKPKHAPVTGLTKKSKKQSKKSMQP